MAMAIAAYCGGLNCKYYKEIANAAINGNGEKNGGKGKRK